MVDRMNTEKPKIYIMHAKIYVKAKIDPDEAITENYPFVPYEPIAELIYRSPRQEEGNITYRVPLHFYLYLEPENKDVPVIVHESNLSFFDSIGLMHHPIRPRWSVTKSFHFEGIQSLSQSPVFLRPFSEYPLTKIKMYTPPPVLMNPTIKIEVLSLRLSDFRPGFLKRNQFHAVYGLGFEISEEERYVPGIHKHRSKMNTLFKSVLYNSVILGQAGELQHKKPEE